MVARRIIEKEMGITHHEFYRLIAVALGTHDFERTIAGVKWSAINRAGEIKLGPEGKRQIALLAVPRTPVTIELEGYDDGATEAMLHLFDRAYQRGGG